VRDAEASLGLEPAALELGDGAVEVSHAMDENGDIALEVVG
jgi:hypothetical protein